MTQLADNTPKPIILVVDDEEQVREIVHLAVSKAGYPHGLAGEDIPLCGRIAGIADVLDVLTSERPYKKAYPVDVSLDIISQNAGRTFDPQTTAVFLDNLNDILAIRAKDVVSDQGSELSRRDQLRI